MGERGRDKKKKKYVEKHLGIQSKNKSRAMLCVRTSVNGGEKGASGQGDHRGVGAATAASGSGTTAIRFHCEDAQKATATHRVQSCGQLKVSYGTLHVHVPVIVMLHSLQRV